MRLFAFFAAIGLVLVPRLAHSITYVTHLATMVDENYQEQHFENDPTLQELAIADPTGAAIARGQIAPGVNKVFSHFDSLDPNNPAAILMADAETYWVDEVLISDPDLNGTLGSFTASLRVFGSASFAMDGAYTTGDADIYGFWDSWIGTSTDGGGSYLVGGWFGNWYSDFEGGIYYEGDELNQEMTEVTLEFIYGQPFLLRTNLVAYFDTENYELTQGTVDGTSDFSHSAYWNGIGAFFDANGNRVDPEFWSQSGVDWRVGIVPEPASVLILTAGLGGLRLLRRSRKA